MCGFGVRSYRDKPVPVTTIRVSPATWFGGIDPKFYRRAGNIERRAADNWKILPTSVIETLVEREWLPLSPGRGRKDF